MSEGGEMSEEDKRSERIYAQAAEAMARMAETMVRMPASVTASMIESDEVIETVDKDTANEAR